jgi:hypothetical protein
MTFICIWQLGDQYDIFFSHAWMSKKYLCEVHGCLVQAQYRVWYDEHDMGVYLDQSMINGIRNSKIVLICLDEIYQTRQNCLFELDEAFKAQQDPDIDVKIVTLVLSKDVFIWASPEVQLKCDLSKTMFFDISKVYEPDHGRWNKSSWEGSDDPTMEMKAELGKEIGKLIVRLRQLNCYPLAR